MSTLRVIGGQQVLDLLAGRDAEVVEAVRGAYLAHAAGRTAVPHSTFLTFPDRPADRIIALPAYLADGSGEAAGIKWVSSFPSNTAAGAERASAVIVLNSMADGRPACVMEGSVINARRTAASAALAARVLHGGAAPARVGAIGCGRIQFEILRFLLGQGPPVASVVLHDLDAARRDRLAATVAGWGIECRPAAAVEEVLAACDLVSFATTAGTPHVDRLDGCPPGATILHVSLRDLAPDAIAACDNVADDIDHVCRASTSLDLAARRLGHRDFIRCAIGDVLAGRQPARAGERTVVFSPFGLGILDVAVARLVAGLAERAGAGAEIPDFLPPVWSGSAT
jgi:ornithine cyclodeaminase